jgi:hypothetical protein
LRGHEQPCNRPASGFDAPCLRSRWPDARGRERICNADFIFATSQPGVLAERTRPSSANSYRLNDLRFAASINGAAPILTTGDQMFFRFVVLRVRAALLPIALAMLADVSLLAQRGDVPLMERARGAERVVVGHVSSVTPLWRENDFGDRLITSIVRVAVDETLKGTALPSVDVEVEGGTIGSLTLRVSDLGTFAPGDRAVFYLKHNRRGGLVPHLRGLGVQRIDRAGRVGGVALDQVRREVRAGAAQRP